MLVYGLFLLVLDPIMNKRRNQYQTQVNERSPQPRSTEVCGQFFLLEHLAVLFNRPLSPPWPEFKPKCWWLLAQHSITELSHYPVCLAIAWYSFVIPIAYFSCRACLVEALAAYHRQFIESGQGLGRNRKNGVATLPSKGVTSTLDIKFSPSHLLYVYSRQKRNYLHSLAHRIYLL